MAYFEITTQKIGVPGQTEVEVYEAANVDLAKAAATKKDWIVTNAKTLASAPAGAKRVKTTKLSRAALGLFCTSVGAMISANVKVPDALRFYGATITNPKFKGTLTTIKDRHDAGDSLDEACRSTGQFDEMFLGLVKAGEMGGVLGEAMEAVSEHIELVDNMVADVRKDAAEPLAAMIIVSIAFTFAQVKYIPNIEKNYLDNHLTMNSFMHVVFGVSHVTQILWPFVFGAVIAGSIAVWRSVTIREKLVAILSKIPAIRDLVWSMRQLTILSTLHLLAKAKMPMATAISIVADVMRGNPLEGRLRKAGEKFRIAGVGIGAALLQTEAVEPVGGYLVTAGEESGTVVSQLHLLTRMYKKLTHVAAKKCVAVIKIAATCTATLMIGFTAVGTMLPVMYMGVQVMESGFKR